MKDDTVYLRHIQELVGWALAHAVYKNQINSMGRQPAHPTELKLKSRIVKLVLRVTSD